MKGKRLLDAMREIDDRWVLDAAPSSAKRSQPSQKRQHGRLWLRWGALAASLLLVATLGLVLFLPYDTSPPDVSRYEGSEYYSIIQKLNQITFDTPDNKNNFELLFQGIQGLFFAKAQSEAPTGAAEGATGDAYVETTDNQVLGVIEADLIKRSDRHIFYLTPEGCLTAYSIAGEDSSAVGSYTIPPRTDAYRQGICEMYLSSDCKTVTVISPCVQKASEDWIPFSFVEVISLDVSDPTAIRQTRSITVSGSYLTSRMVEGRLLLASGFYVGKNPDFSKEECFLPQIDCGEGKKSIPCADILSPETLTSSGYTVVCSFSEQGLALEDSAAFLSYSQELYVSADSIYATRCFTESLGGDTNGVTVTWTEINRLLYSEGAFRPCGAVVLPGYVLNQYSLDQYEGQLRVVTTTQKDVAVTPSGPNEWGLVTRFERITNASLYCIDLSTMQILSKVEHFAPDGETVQSVRFDGTAAYVCTAVRATDPVFFFDLSDPQSITYTDTGTIPGFSTSLIQLGEGYLLGIGRGESASSVKLEIYEEREGSVVSVASKLYSNAYYSTHYKSYLIDREAWLFGLGISDGNYDTGRYVLLTFDGTQLIELVSTPLSGHLDTVRAVRIEDMLYLFSDTVFKVLPMP